MVYTVFRPESRKEKYFRKGLYRFKIGEESVLSRGVVLKVRNTIPAREPGTVYDQSGNSLFNFLSLNDIKK